MQQLWKKILIMTLFNILFHLISSADNSFSELISGTIYDKEQSMNSINIYQFNSLFTPNVYLHQQQGFPRLYGYYTKNISSFELTVEDLYELDYLGELDNAFNIYSTSYMKIKIGSNFIFNEEQYVILVLCPNKENCKYSIVLSESSITLKENRTFLLYSSDTLMIKCSDSKITNHSKIKIEVTPIFNIIYPSFILNNIGVKATEQVLSVNDYYSIALTDKDKDSILQIQWNKLIGLTDVFTDTFYFIRYSIGEEEDNNIIIDKGISQIYDISSNQKKTFSFGTIQKQLVFFIKAQNCILHIRKMDNNQVINDSKTSFYQTIINKDDSYTIEVSLEEEDSICKFIEYSYENDITGRVILLEGIEQEFTFTNNIDKFVLLYPFYLQSSDNNQNAYIYLNVRLSDKTLIQLEKNYSGKKIFYSSESEVVATNTTLMLNNEIKNHCLNQNICLFKLIITPTEIKEEPQSFSIQFGGSQYKQMYCKKNELCSYYHNEKKDAVIYTEVKKWERGEIIWNYQNEIIEPLFYIVEKNNVNQNKEDILNADYSMMKIALGRAEYYVDERYSCKKGCDLYIIITNTEKEDRIIEEIGKETMNTFQIIIKEQNKSIIGDMYQIIYGHILNFSDKYEFILPTSIKGFQIKLFGYHTKFYIEDLNNTHICCDNMQKEYSATSSNFINYEIYPHIDTKDYNIHIRITVIPNSNVLFEENYELQIIPFYKIDHQIYFVNNNNRIIECKPDKNNKCYLVFDYAQSTTITYNIPKNKKGQLINFTVHHLDIIDYVNGNWTELFEHNDTYIPCMVNWEDYIEHNSFTIISYFLSYKLFVSLKFDCNDIINILPSATEPIFPIKLLNDYSQFYQIENSIDISGIFYSYGDINNTQMIFTVFPYKNTGTLEANKINLRLNGPTTVIADYSYLIDFPMVIKPSSSLTCSLKYNFKLKKPFLMHNFNLNKANSIVFMDALPYRIVYEMDQNESNFTLNLKIQTEGNSIYNYSNLDIQFAYINSTTLSNLNENHSIADIFDNQTLQYINNKQISIIDLLISDEQRKDYKYLYIKITEKETTDTTNLKMSVTLEGIERIKDKLPETPLPINLFFFNYIEPDKSNSTYYLLENTGNPFYVEFASCSNDNYTFTFYNNSNIIENAISEQFERNGKIYMLFSAGWQYQFLYLKIELISKNPYHNYNKLYHGIKYTPDKAGFKGEYTFIQNLKTTFNEGNSEIQSTWGQIENTNTFRVDYIHMIYNRTEHRKSSICFVEEPVNQTNLIDNTYDWQIEKGKEFDYQSVIIATFYNSNEEIMIGYNIEKVSKKYSLIWLWLIIVFVFVFIFFLFTTFTLYQEIDKKVKKSNLNILIECKDK